MTVEHDPSSPVLYQHSRRPQWGLAILCSEDKTSRKFQFQDGRSRTFKEGFYHLLEPVEHNEGDADLIVASLSKAMDRAVTRTRIMERAKKEGRNIFTVGDQVSLFRKIYPNGFQDETYIEQVRQGGGANRRRKKNREAGLEVAQELLGQSVMDEALYAHDYRSIYDSAIKVLSCTDIASTSTERQRCSSQPDHCKAEEQKQGQDPRRPKSLFGHIELRALANFVVRKVVT